VYISITIISPEIWVSMYKAIVNGSSVHSWWEL
jgi:hypothetical protein